MYWSLCVSRSLFLCHSPLAHIPAWQHKWCPRPASLSRRVTIATGAIGEHCVPSICKWVMDKTTRTEPYWVAGAPHGFAVDLYHTSKQESPSTARLRCRLMGLALRCERTAWQQFGCVSTNVSDSYLQQGNKQSSVDISQKRNLFGACEACLNVEII